MSVKYFDCTHSRASPCRRVGRKPFHLSAAGSNPAGCRNIMGKLGCRNRRCDVLTEIGVTWTRPQTNALFNVMLGLAIKMPSQSLEFLYLVADVGWVKTSGDAFSAKNQPGESASHLGLLVFRGGLRDICIQPDHFGTNRRCLARSLGLLQRGSGTCQL